MTWPLSIPAIRNRTIIRLRCSNELGHVPARSSVGRLLDNLWSRHREPNLPGFMVLHGHMPRGGKPIWSPGFLPRVYQPTSIDGRNNTPISNLARQAKMTDTQQRAQLDMLNAMNRDHQMLRPHEADLAARLESFELAYRMQTAAPEAMDLGQESQQTHKAYGIGQKETELVAKQCLTARRLIERGVRFVQLYAGTNGGRRRRCGCALGRPQRHRRQSPNCSKKR